ncbi:MAG: formate dehydrogenase accessory sulfurtransferase FdhD [Methanobacteriaceae archaeon]
MPKMFKKVNATRVGKETFDFEEKIVLDGEIELIINDTSFGRFSVSPNNLKEFAVGYALGEGLVDSVDNITRLKLNDNEIELKIDLTDFDIRRELVMSSDCFGGLRSKLELLNKVESNYTISRDDIFEAFKKLIEHSITWRETGGTHIASLVTKDHFIATEDVSRHVAIDKVMGAGALEGFDFSKSFIACSGRMPSDMVMKVARVGIPILTSKAAPTVSGYAAGEKSGMTLVGFVRGKRFNIYTNPQRIQI